jgi:threonine/homoserine/homoserine lactone efflux protein
LPGIDINPRIEEDFPMTQLLLLFIAAAGILTITPGVDTAMVLRTSAADGPRGGRFLAKPRVVRNMDRLTGCVFVGFGLKLALAKRS